MSYEPCADTSRTWEAYGIVEVGGKLLAVYLDEATAKEQLRYFSHRIVKIIKLKGGD